MGTTATTLPNYNFSNLPNRHDSQTSFSQINMLSTTNNTNHFNTNFLLTSNSFNFTNGLSTKVHTVNPKVFTPSTIRRTFQNVSTSTPTPNSFTRNFFISTKQTKKVMT